MGKNIQAPMPYYATPVRTRKVVQVLVVRDWHNHTLDYRLPLHVARALVAQNRLVWDYSNNCYFQPR